MHSFRDHIAQRNLLEGNIGKAALLKYAADAKAHGAKSAKAYQSVLHILNAPEGATPASTHERIQAALVEIAKGNLHQRDQIGALVAMVASLALSTERAGRK